jgi:glycosyltransferase involved in cell wall biosynthesis
VKVLVVHNRYRLAGGEERAVELQLAALKRAGVEYATVMQDSADVSRSRAARALLRGGEHPDEIAAAVRLLRADVVHVHNMHPLFGPRALAAAKDAGARVVFHLHNFRLFCSIATCFRDGEPCFRCRGRFTLPGLVLNCRDSLAESAVYTSALALHQPTVLDSVDAFVTPSEYARGQLARLGLSEERVTVLPNYVLAAAERSSARDGRYAVAFGRLSQEKGFAVAAEAAEISGVPVKIAGEGPLEPELRGRRGGELVGRLDADGLAELLSGASMAVIPSLGGDVMPFAALEAMAAGVPVIASRSGSLPEIVGEERCVRRGDPHALAAAMRTLHDDPERRQAEGDALIARVAERFGEERYVRGLRAIYAGTHAHA